VQGQHKRCRKEGRREKSGRERTAGEKSGRAARRHVSSLWCGAQSFLRLRHEQFAGTRRLRPCSAPRPLETTWCKRVPKSEEKEEDHKNCSRYRLNARSRSRSRKSTISTSTNINIKRKLTDPGLSMW